MSAPLLEATNGTGCIYDTQPFTNVEQRSRKLAIYPASAGFDLLKELEYLCARAIEPNIFFSPRFLAPAMPRLGKAVKLAIIRDQSAVTSRLRLLMPFTIKRTALPLAVPVIRIWSNEFGPLGTPLVDHDDPVCCMEDFFSMLAQPQLKLPKVMVLPDIRTDGPFAAALHSVAESRNLPLLITSEVARPYLKSDLEGEAYLRKTLQPHHFREFCRLKRRLQQQGNLEYKIGRQPEEIRTGIEAFLKLEAAGWKGRKKTAMAANPHQAAFAREAVQLLGQADQCRIHMLTLDGHAIAILIVFIACGVAYTWKTSFDEAYASYSPGTLLMIETTQNHLEDPNIVETDSCALPDHVVMSRLWGERRSLATYVIGLSPGNDRQVRRAVNQLTLYREARSTLRLLRNNVHRFLRRK